jgi:enoyl-CoA hydratase
MSDELVRYETSDDVATLTMDDGKANALSPAMIEALQDALSRAEKEAKAVVLVGRPGRFCAGFDLKIMMSGPEPAKKLVSDGADLLMRMYAFPKPLVIACTGHAIAGGALILLVGDTRICAEGEFKLGLNEVSIGMTLPVLAQELARDRLDPRHLVQATVQSTIYAPQDAAAAGFVDRVAPPESLLEQAHSEAKRLSALPEQAYAATKARLRRKTIGHIRETLEADMAEIAAPLG